MVMNDQEIIRFEGYNIREIEYRVIKEPIDDESGEKKENTIEIDVEAGINSDKTQASILLIAIVKDVQQSREIKCSVQGDFSILDESLSEEQITKFLGRNAVSIIFPYVRTCISMISSLDSSQAIVLPLINTKVFDEKSQ